MEYIIYIISILAVYLIGSISPSIIIYRKKEGGDIRDIGSKSAGTTNVARGLGKKYAVLVFVLDFLKGIIAVPLARIIITLFGLVIDSTISIFSGESAYYSTPWIIPVSVFAVILAHVFPVYYGFKGGKGVACGLGACLWLSPIVGGYIIIVIASLALIIRTISIASLISFGTAPFVALFMPYIYYNIIGQPALIAGPDWLGFSLFLALAVIIFFTHRENIQRIIKGTESSIAKK